LKLDAKTQESARTGIALKRSSKSGT